ncbi:MULTISPECIES: TRAP transporter large permease [Desulfococcus]|jgi:tripartite ATP-independent transporter DctM subunit|uniref:TRAP dicarboxylate transporter, DctM subunit n=1 Tax=Desulfococcus multivorans DSM 2059 TaxID=1121405 RepID=S7UPJ8_DESML|nr:TRAP transporter large permease subunit [Desulfococcus multivorans]AOY59947.1 DctM5: C4-TRAP dicarboxylate transport system permease [Desulfococcus multivorans]AQV02098.1 C4-dicarboxylate ABC transporter [Desulfococcus multivorans]EPR35944.1 TRAP dicarboxylate transporter, DctM subunit [Desulfococcus multivorans DSM 2059]MDX9819236.1 TRAP transporter large permease subunit [Desulfococcus multivorans]SJZ35566.1 TRAP transporter, DctM subunit [Desulfococcus multivorans DSM 2059]
MSLYLLIPGLLLLTLSGAPIFAVILATAMVGFHYLEVDLSVIAIELYRIAETPVLVALPLFTFAGYLLGESKTSRRLVRLTRAFIGWMPGGPAVVAFTACALFTAFTGASGVTIVALGGLLLPALGETGYSEKFSLGLVTASGSLGLLLPPSLPLILYGIVAQQLDVGRTVTFEDLFLAGIPPAILMVLLLSLYSLWANRHSPTPLTRFSGREAWAALKEAAWEVPLPLFILGGIYSGYFAVSEAAAVTALYVLVVEVLVYREISFSALPGIMRESMVMVGGILLILGVSLAFTNFLIDAEVPDRLFQAIQARVTDPMIFLILLNILLLVLGMLLDIFSAVIIMVPLILPVAVSYGIDPVHLGIVFLANMQIGYFTPPVGMNLFIAGYRFKKPVIELYRAALPFMAVLLAAVVIITYFPRLSLLFIRP